MTCPASSATSRTHHGERDYFEHHGDFANLCASPMSNCWAREGRFNDLLRLRTLTGVDGPGALLGFQGPQPPLNFGPALVGGAFSSGLRRIEQIAAPLGLAQFAA